MSLITTSRVFCNFNFLSLPDDLQQYVFLQMEDLDKYFFLLSAKANSRFSVLIQLPIARRTNLFFNAVQSDRKKLMIYLLPQTLPRFGNHWITRDIAKKPEHFWSLLGYGFFMQNYYKWAATKLHIMLYLLSSSRLCANSLASLIQFAVTFLQVDEYYLVRIIDMLEQYPERNRLKYPAIKKLLGMLVRNRKGRLVDRVLQQYQRLPPMVLNAVVRRACDVNTVPEPMKRLQRFYS